MPAVACGWTFSRRRRGRRWINMSLFRQHWWREDRVAVTAHANSQRRSDSHWFPVTPNVVLSMMNLTLSGVLYFLGKDWCFANMFSSACQLLRCWFMWLYCSTLKQQQRALLNLFSERWTGQQPDCSSLNYSFTCFRCGQSLLVCTELHVNHETTLSNAIVILVALNITLMYLFRTKSKF